MSRRLNLSLTAVTVLLVLMIGCLTAGSLWLILRMHSRFAHAMAAQSVAELGNIITTYLAAEAGVAEAGAEEQHWKQFSRLVHGLHAMEGGLQYVSVTVDGVVVYHEQMRELGGMDGRREEQPAGPAGGTVRLDRKLLGVGDTAIPVVTFATDFAGAGGATGVVETALRRETVAREEYGVARAVSRMFRVSLATVAVSFAISLCLILWLMRREKHREEQRRREEHLAFSGVFANGIAHDFRNPMSSVKLDAQMLHKESSRGGECRPDRVAQLAERMRSTIDRMDKSFHEFLYLSRPPSDTVEAVDLQACIRECIDILGPRLERAEVGVSLNAAERGIKVEAHPVSLQRALINVVTNAEQFSARGDTVDIDIYRSGRRAVVEVKDRGPGIPKAERKRVFEMFATSRPGGTGLGLFLARTAIERCGGTIEAVDNDEGGACLRICLPLAGAGGKAGGPTGT